MADKTRVYWLHALTGVHVGAGTGAGFIDLPILRERVTEWPYIPGTSVKGVLAAGHGDAMDRKNKDPKVLAAFGVADPDNESGGNAGSLVFTDARLVCLPVPSFLGTFAWVTSWLALRRLARDLATAGATPPPIGASAGQSAQLCDETVLASGGKVYASDIDFDARPKEAEAWGAYLADQVMDGDWKIEFKRRFAILPEDSFNHFCRYGCEVVPRVKIEAGRKTVQHGALWLEESLPAESILCGLVWCDKIYVPGVKCTQQELLKDFCKDSACTQFGGKATVGRGRMQVRFRG